MNSSEQAQERLLVLRCQAGDERAYTELYRRYHAPLVYYLRRMLAHPESSEDALHNVWIKVLRGIALLRDPEAFRTWIYRIAHNEALMWLRKYGPVVEFERLEAVGEAAEQYDDLHVDDANAGDAQAIHAALGELTPPQREVLVLRYLEELSYNDIATVTGVGVGTVRSRIYYAKQSLKKILEERQPCEIET